MSIVTINKEGSKPVASISVNDAPVAHYSYKYEGDVKEGNSSDHQKYTFPGKNDCQSMDGTVLECVAKFAEVDSNSKDALKCEFKIQQDGSTIHLEVCKGNAGDPGLHCVFDLVKFKTK